MFGERLQLKFRVAIEFAMQGDTLYIVDGYGIFFRAFFAMKTLPPHLREYNAIFGTMRMLIAFINQFSPSKMIVALDSGGTTFRDDLYESYVIENEVRFLVSDLDRDLSSAVLSKAISEEKLILALNMDLAQVVLLCDFFKIKMNYHAILMIYKNLLNFDSQLAEKKSRYKANRPETPVALRSQFAILDELLSAIGILGVRKEYFEADDIIATICKKYKNKHNVVIVSADKDLMQLIDKNVQIYNPNTKSFLDEVSFLEEYGFPASAFADYLSLVGDRADNVPGVKGIGKKQATALIRKHGSINGILENASDVPPKVRLLLEESMDTLILSRHLVQLCDHVELPHLNYDFRIKNKTLQNFIDKYNLKFTSAEHGEGNNSPAHTQSVLFE